MKSILLIIIGIGILSCGGSKKSKYDFSSVQSTSLDANHTNNNVKIMKDTTIVVPAPIKN